MILFTRWVDFLNGAQPGKFFNLGNPRVLSGVFKDMETAEGVESQPRTYLFGYYAAISNSETIEPRRGKGKEQGEGQGQPPGREGGVV